MQFSGQDYRPIGATKQLSFLISGGFFDNITGAGVFGFSGSWITGNNLSEDRKLEFTFDKGKIIDPENKYIYSYLPNENINLSGNIYDDNYEYYINDIPISFTGSKKKYIIDNMYIHSTGHILDASLYVSMNKPSYAFTQGDGFSKAGSYNINIKNNNPTLPFVILSGSFENENLIINNLPLKVETNSNIIVTAHEDLATGDFEETLSLSTSVGDITNDLTFKLTE